MFSEEKMVVKRKERKRSRPQDSYKTLN